MIVISDTSPITALLTINQIEILEKIYKQVIIPEAVYNELLVEHIDIPEFIKIDKVMDRHKVELLLNEIDLGEAESIVLAKEKNADLVLIDEQIGRKIAEREGLQIIGLIGVILIAKKKRYIDSIRQIISLLEEKAGFWISDSLKKYVFEIAEELE